MKTRNRYALRLFLPRSKHSKAPRAKHTFKKGSTVDKVLLPGPKGPRVSPGPE
jgi:hypothetical protein